MDQVTTTMKTLDMYSSIFKDVPDIVNVHEMATLLGIGLTLAYSLVKSGIIPCRKVGREYKIAKFSLIKFLFNNQ